MAEPKGHPFHGGRCYACDRKAVGLCDRRRHYPEDAVVPACRRHADPTVRKYDACIYCNGVVRKGSVTVDDDFAHKSCCREQGRA